MNHVRENGKPQSKLLYKLFKGEDKYDTLLDINSFPTLIQLKDFLGGIDHCVTVLGEWILKVIFLLEFLSLVTIWTTDILMIMKQKK